jgi:hypothetical protein
METVRMGEAEIKIRRAGPEDADAIARLLHDFNDEYSEPTPGVAALTEYTGRLLAEGEITVLLAAATDNRLSPAEIDAALWNRGREPRYKAIPRPRSRNTAY